MNTTKHESHGAVAGQVDCRVRPHAWVHESGHFMLAESTSADDAQLLHRGWLPMYLKPAPLDEKRIQKLGETIGAKVPGYSDFESWGHGYRVDDTGTHTIPNTPANLVPFARAIERELFGA